MVAHPVPYLNYFMSTTESTRIWAEGMRMR